MKRVVAVVVMALFFVGFASMVMAQDAETDTDTGASVMEQEEGVMDMGQMGKMKGKMKGKMMHRKKDMGRDKMAMMMKPMMQKQIVATKDGGVVVLSGNRLLKYDKNLNLKSETQIPMDKEWMHEIMRNCPMGMKMRMGEPGEEEIPEMEEE